VNSGDRFENARKRRLGVGVEEPAEATQTDDEPVTAGTIWRGKVAAQEQRQRDARQQRQQREQQREEKHFTAQAATGGTTLDQETLKAKQAYEAERRRPKGAEVKLPDHSVIFALIEKYLYTDAGPRMYLSQDNFESICNYIVKGLVLGTIELSLQAVADAHAWLLAHGFIELAPGESVDRATGGIVRKRGDVSRPASRVYPPFIHPSHEVQDRLVQMRESQNRWIAERQQLKQDLDSGKLSFEQLQRQVRKGFKPPKPGGPEFGGV
jgi:hypothetical protein